MSFHNWKCVVPYADSWMASSSSLQNIIILDRTWYFFFAKNLVDVRNEAWLNLFWEYINGKLFAVGPLLLEIVRKVTFLHFQKKLTFMYAIAADKILFLYTALLLHHSA